MKRISFWLSMAFALLFFALLFLFFRENSTPVTINYIVGSITLDLSLVLLASFVAGALLTLLIMLCGQISRSWIISKQKSELKRLQNHIDDLRKSQA
ncbi:hypothetical protein AwWohl_04330 [Gammaproteobacteria bacterium]|nr:hypothetical protein AwWohl_04330 [Gammaproteobacteria bacterium]